MLRSNWGQPLFLRCYRANLPWSKQRNAKIFLTFGNLKWIMGCPYSRSGLKWFSLIIIIIFQYLKILWFSENFYTNFVSQRKPIIVEKVTHVTKPSGFLKTYFNTLIFQPMLHELCTTVAWPILSEHYLCCITSAIRKLIKLWKSLICMDL